MCCGEIHCQLPLAFAVYICIYSFSQSLYVHVLILNWSAPDRMWNLPQRNKRTTLAQNWQLNKIIRTKADKDSKCNKRRRYTAWQRIFTTQQRPSPHLGQTQDMLHCTVKKLTLLPAVPPSHTANPDYVKSADHQEEQGRREWAMTRLAPYTANIQDKEWGNRLWYPLLLSIPLEEFSMVLWLIANLQQSLFS